MRIFLSWSGIYGNSVAQALASWLPKLINAVQPFVSSEIDKGARWPEEVAQHLAESEFGIIILTPESVNEPWLLFEAGAMLKTSRKSRVCTFLVGVEPGDIEWPLAQFQATVASDASDVRRLIETINQAVNDSGKSGLKDRYLEDVFNKYWPDLKSAIQKVPHIDLESDPLDGKSDDFVISRAQVIYHAENLKGKLSRPIEDPSASNGHARYAHIQGRSDHIVFGPYQPLETPGAYVAFYKIKIGQDAPYGELLYLDVAGGGQGDRQLHRASFPATGVYQTFAVHFHVNNKEAIEYRVLPVTQRGQFWVDYVAIVNEGRLLEPVGSGGSALTL